MARQSTWRGLGLAGALGLCAAAAADPYAGIEAAEISPQVMRQRPWAYCDEDLSGPVQNRLFAQRQRPRVSLWGGTYSGDPALSTQVLGATLGYHFTEVFGANLWGWTAFSGPRDFGVISSAALPLNRPRAFFGVELRADLVYGKFDFLGWAVPRISFYATGGLGWLTYQTGNRVSWTAGLGESLHLSQRFALDLDLKFIGSESLSHQVTLGLTLSLDPTGPIRPLTTACDATRPEISDPLAFTAPPPPPEDPRMPEVPPAELSSFEAILGVQSTSDLMNDRALTLMVRNHRRDAFWEYPGEAKSGLDLGLTGELHDGSNSGGEYAGGKAYLTGGYKFSSAAQAHVSLGVHRLVSHTNGAKANSTFAQVDAVVQPVENLYLDAAVNHDYIYQELIQPGGVLRLISAYTVKANVFYWPDGPIHLNLRTETGFFSDHNVRRNFDVSAMYGISREVPWVWVGAGAEYLSYTQRDPDYWTPTRFLGVGPRFESDFPLTSRLSLAMGVNLNLFQEEQFDWAFGYYGSGRLRYGNRSSFYVDLSYVRIQTVRNDATWYSNGAFLGMGTSF
jgi:hypothetical protein